MTLPKSIAWVVLLAAGVVWFLMIAGGVEILITHL